MLPRPVAAGSQEASDARLREWQWLAQTSSPWGLWCGLEGTRAETGRGGQSEREWEAEQNQGTMQGTFQERTRFAGDCPATLSTRRQQCPSWPPTCCPGASGSTCAKRGWGRGTVRPCWSRPLSCEMVSLIHSLNGSFLIRGQPCAMEGTRD